VRALAAWHIPGHAGPATWHHFCALGRVQCHNWRTDQQPEHPKHHAATGRLGDCCGGVQCAWAAQPQPCPCSKVSIVQSPLSTTATRRAVARHCTITHIHTSECIMLESAPLPARIPHVVHAPAAAACTPPALLMLNHCQASAGDADQYKQRLTAMQCSCADWRSAHTNDTCCLPCVCSPSPSPAAPLASPSPAPVPAQLALLSQFPPNYGGPTANISAVGPGSCVKSPSTMLGGSVTVQQPGAGLCEPLPPGTYQVTQVPPPGTTFVRWDVFNATTGALISSPTNPSITLPLDGSVTVVAVYSAPGLPSPSPAPVAR
jgi:hypothetical protein